MTASFLLAASLFIWIRGADGKCNSATGGELRGDNRLARRTCFHKIVQNAVRDRFIEGALAAIRCKIELERFAFDAKAVRDVIDVYPGKIRLTRDWANRSKIVRLKMNPVIAARRVGKSLKPRLRR